VRLTAVASLPPGLVDRIAGDAAAYFGLEVLPRARAAWMIDNPYSKVLCLELTQDQWTRRFFAKLPRAPVTPTSTLPAMMRKEYELLKLLDSHGPSAQNAGTVQALAFYPDVPSVVTVEAVGRTLRKEYSLKARVGATRYAQASLLHHAELCGHWLSDFHTRMTVSHDRFDVDDVLSYCRIRLTKLRESHPSLLSEGGQNAIEEAVRRLSRQMDSDSLRVSGRHNDFASHNIIACHDGGIRVLDFMAYDEGANAFDVCNFWFDLETLKYDPTYSTSVLTAMQGVFLKAYGEVHPDQPDFRLAQLRYSVNRLLNELGRTSPWRLISPRWHLHIRATRRWLRDFAEHPA
jgi:hypothetical protein